MSWKGSPLGIGTIVCVHNHGRGTNAWIGEVCSVIGGAATIYRVKQMGYRQVTAFSFDRDELRETVVTLRGPMCIECKLPL